MKLPQSMAPTISLARLSLAEANNLIMFFSIIVARSSRLLLLNKRRLSPWRGNRLELSSVVVETINRRLSEALYHPCSTPYRIA